MTKSLSCLSRGYTCNFFLAMAMQFQEIIALPSQGKNARVARLALAMPSHRVAGLQFFRAMATQ